ncbi:uncharacterized protein CXQ87_003953 [Candidozyma duobushaemuli]|uniref:Uncharacterized protein n=2 Tax=Candidozyma TaxID=3303203 RepID=A0ABX8I854_9ASCO|nr:uncharacterized protein CXQ87_003953 [[Candida] duobushaemulonis]PVH16089.1 hypothetical protein CXQ87_003953 [[Candida] duobushaemulonis]QWU89227.1 hypothetical protein CA3LBN_003550 [[Candida] haemuloni]
MSIPIVTIPEAAFDAAGLAGVVARRRSRLFQYFLKLTNGSAALLILAYIIGIFGIRPLLETRAFRRLDLLESARSKLRDLYLNVIGRVEHIPIVALHRPGTKKLYAEAVCQTSDSQASDDTELKNIRTLGSEKLYQKLGVLNAGLKQCTSFSIGELPSYRSVDSSIKQFQQKTDNAFFSHRDMFFRDVLQADGTSKEKNLASEAKGEIRGIKGLFMSGQAY